MKVISTILLVAVAAAYGGVRCPSEQAADWKLDLLLPHEDCTKFYKCAHGQPIEMKCPEGLYYNAEDWVCDWPNNVACGNRIDPEKIPSPVSLLPKMKTESKPKAVEFFENGCPIDPTLHWLVADIENCSIFYYCVFGQKIQRECPENMHFSSEDQICDWPDRADCASSIKKHQA